MRTLTLVIELEELSDASWIWDSHMWNSERNGITVLSISDGNYLDKEELMMSDNVINEVSKNKRSVP